MRKLSLAITVAGLAMVVALTGCGGGGGGGGSKSTPPPATANTVVTGIVMDTQTPSSKPVSGVIVRVGTHQALTGSDGRFRMDMGSTEPLQNLFPNTWSATFVVSTEQLDPNKYSTSFPVKYLNVQYAQEPNSTLGNGASIPLPFEALYAQGTVDLGTITVTYFDPSAPPPPPY